MTEIDRTFRTVAELAQYALSLPTLEDAEGLSYLVQDDVDSYNNGVWKIEGRRMIGPYESSALATFDTAAAKVARALHLARTWATTKNAAGETNPVAMAYAAELFETLADRT